MVVPQRVKAFAVHLAASALIFSVVVGALLLFWYPTPYYRIEGLWDGLRIAIGVDLVLGPTLTLIVFKVGKPSLKFDLCCIALLQVAALVYGATSIYKERPYMVVFIMDRFQTVRWHEIEGQGRPDTELIALHDAALGNPPRIALRPTTNSKELRAMLAEVTSKPNGTVLKLTSYYTQITPDVWKKIRYAAYQMDKLAPEDQKMYQDFCIREQCHIDQIAAFSLTGRAEGQIIVLNKETGALIGYL